MGALGRRQDARPDRPQAPGRRPCPRWRSRALQVGRRSLAWLQTQTSPTGPVRGSAGRGAGPERGTIHPLFLRPPGACRPRGNGGGGAPASSLTHRRPLARARGRQGPAQQRGSWEGQAAPKSQASTLGTLPGEAGPRGWGLEAHGHLPRLPPSPPAAPLGAPPPPPVRLLGRLGGPP